MKLKGVILLVAVIAACASVGPSMASAAGWDVVGSEHTLDSPTFGFSHDFPIFGPYTVMCTQSTFTAGVRSAASLTITGAQFKDCSVKGGPYSNCTATWTGTGFPWNATAVAATTVQIDGIHIDVVIGPCNTTQKFTLTGTLPGGQWSNGAGQHEVTFTNASGLNADPLDPFYPTPVSGTLRDTSQTLTMTP